jgi:hypothetical protein
MGIARATTDALSGTAASRLRRGPGRAPAPRSPRREKPPPVSKLTKTQLTLHANVQALRSPSQRRWLARERSERFEPRARAQPGSGLRSPTGRRRRRARRSRDSRGSSAPYCAVAQRRRGRRADRGRGCPVGCVNPVPRRAADSDLGSPRASRLRGDDGHVVGTVNLSVFGVIRLGRQHAVPPGESGRSRGVNSVLAPHRPPSPDDGGLGIDC